MSFQEEVKQTRPISPDDFVPHGDYVLLQPLDADLQAKAQTIVVVHRQVDTNRGVVLRCGPSVAHVSPGDIVHWPIPVKDSAVIFLDGKKFAAMPEKALVGRLTGPAAAVVRGEYKTDYHPTMVLADDPTAADRKLIEEASR